MIQHLTSTIHRNASDPTTITCLSCNQRMICFGAEDFAHQNHSCPRNWGNIIAPGITVTRTSNNPNKNSRRSSNNLGYNDANECQLIDNTDNVVELKEMMGRN